MKYVKYRTQKQQVSYDGGETWEDTGEIRKGEYLGVYDTAEECANATVPPYDVVPQAHENAKATLLLDDGTEIDLPFVGRISGADDSFVDDYAFTIYDLSMSYAGSAIKDNRDYIAEHCIRIVVSNQVRYVCDSLTRNGEPNGILGFGGYLAIGYDKFGMFRSLSEIFFPDSVKYISMDGHYTQVTKIKLPSLLDYLNLVDFVYYDKELVVPESFSGGGDYFLETRRMYVCDTVKKVVSYSNSFPKDYWNYYSPSAHTILLYNETVPSAIGADNAIANYTYVRDELLDDWINAYLVNHSSSTSRAYNVKFFPLSIYNTDFRSPNDNEKFVARLSDGTLYSVPIGNGVVTSGDVEDIRSKICDIKFGSAVTAITNGVFGYRNNISSLNPRHFINLIEFNSDVDLSDCDVYNITIDKVKLNGNNFFNTFRTVYMRDPTLRYCFFYWNVGRIYVPDAAFEAYVKSLPLKYTVTGYAANSVVTDYIRLAFRPMSSFKIND